MAAAFPITIQAAESLTMGTIGEFQYINSKSSQRADKIFRILCILQAISLSYILILQLFVPIIFESRFFNLIVCETWVNIFYTTGLFYGIYINLYPTKPGIACYIGLEGLIAFLAFQKILTDIHIDFNSLLGPRTSAKSRSDLILWTSLSVNNGIVFLSALLLLFKYAFVYRCKPEPVLQDV